MAGPRQRHGERAALPDLTFDGGRAALRLDQLLGDGQSQPRADPAARHLAAIEALEDVRQYSGFDARPRIAHTDRDPIVILSGRQLDGCLT